MSVEHSKEMVELFAKEGYTLKQTDTVEFARIECAKRHGWTTVQKKIFLYHCKRIWETHATVTDPIFLRMRTMAMEYDVEVIWNSVPQNISKKIAKKYEWTEEQRKAFLYKVIGFTITNDSNTKMDIIMLKDLAKKYGIDDSKTPNSKRQYLKLFSQYYIYIPYHIKGMHVLLTKNNFERKVNLSSFQWDMSKKGIVLQALLHHVPS